MSIFEVQPPRWLQDITQPVSPGETGQIFGTLIAGIGNAYQTAKQKNDEGGDTTWIKEIPGGIKDAELNVADPLWRLKVQQSQLAIANQKIKMDMQQNDLDVQKQQTAWMNHDVQTFPQWMKDHPTPESRTDATPPELRTQQFQKAYENIVKGDINHDAQRDFAKQVDELRKLDPIAAAKYAGLIGKPIPAKAADQLAKDTATAKAKTPTDLTPVPFTKIVDGKPVSGLVNPKTGHFEELKPDALTKAETTIVVDEIKKLSDQLRTIDRASHLDDYIAVQSQINAARKRLRGLLSGQAAAPATPKPDTQGTNSTTFKVGDWQVTPVP